MNPFKLNLHPAWLAMAEQATTISVYNSYSECLGTGALVYAGHGEFEPFNFRITQAGVPFYAVVTDSKNRAISYGPVGNEYFDLLSVQIPRGAKLDINDTIHITQFRIGY